MSIGPEVDLTDPAILGAAAAWRDAGSAYRSPVVPQIDAPEPVLRPAM